jgi:hypothetical protein
MFLYLSQTIYYSEVFLPIIFVPVRLLFSYHYVLLYINTLIFSVNKHGAFLTNEYIKFLVKNQLDEKFFFLICLFQSATCFEQHRAHHQENQLYKYNFWYMLLCVRDRPVCRSGRNFPTCVPDGHPHRVTYTRRCIDTINSPDDEHGVAWNM